MLYLLQIIIYTGIMLGVYLILLRDRPMHKFNRFFLLSSTIIPVLLPFIHLPISLLPQNNAVDISLLLPEVLVTNDNSSAKETIASYTIVWILYSLVVVAILGSIIYKHVRLYSIINRSEREHHDKYIILKNTEYGPSSWMKYIFLTSSDTHKAIIDHELAHIHAHHSYDVLYIDILKAFFWPNIFLHLLKKELLMVHEYQADDVAGKDTPSYSKILVGALFHTQTLPLTHTFIFHPIKRRIMMLNKKKTPHITRSIVAIASLLILCSTLVSFQGYEPRQSFLSDDDNDTIWWGPAISYNDDSIRTSVHKMPEFQGDLVEYLSENLKYTDYAMEHKLEGQVIVKFVVDKEGSVAQKEIISSPHDSLSMSVINMLYDMPAWKPAEDEDGKHLAVWYTLPVNFKLPSGKRN